MSTRPALAADLLRLHESTRILVLANVWDVGSAEAVAAVDGVAAIATASHAIATAHGYPDGEQIPLDLHLAAIERICAAVALPVTADLEAGYGDPGETTRRAIAVGAVGMNLEDQLKPLAEAVAAVEAVVAAREAEGTGFVLNARTDAFLRAPEGTDPVASLADAIARGQAFLDAGAECVFVPGVGDLETVGALVDALGPQKVSVFHGPGAPSVRELEQAGVARVSIGPNGYRVALAALQSATADLLAGGSLSA
jgi:2-methylisocitrate lyase-like PEP mutase family enzyme